MPAAERIADPPPDACPLCDEPAEPESFDDFGACEPCVEAGDELLADERIDVRRWGP